MLPQRTVTKHLRPGPGLGRRSRYPKGRIRSKSVAGRGAPLLIRAKRLFALVNGLFTSTNKLFAASDKLSGYSVKRFVYSVKLFTSTKGRCGTAKTAAGYPDGVAGHPQGVQGDWGRITGGAGAWTEREYESASDVLPRGSIPALTRSVRPLSSLAPPPLPSSLVFSPTTPNRAFREGQSTTWRCAQLPAADF